MKIREMRDAIRSIRPTYTVTKGKRYKRFEAHVGIDQDGKRIRIVGNTAKTVQERVRDWYATCSSSPQLGSTMPPTRLADAVMAFAVLDEAGITDSLYRIVTEYAKKSTKKSQSKPMMDAYDVYMAKFNEAQTAQIDYVKRTVGKFVALHATRYVSDITADDVQKYMDSIQPCAVKTFNNTLGYIKTFFNWCAKAARGWCEKEFLEGIEAKTQENKEIEAASVDAIRELFRTTLRSDSMHKDFLLYRYALSCFGGMRSEEITRLNPDDIRMDDGSILVRDPKGSQSGSRISYRTFEINPTLREWLNVVDMNKVEPYLTMSSINWCRVSRQMREKVKGHKFPNNFGRHSFISYHVAMLNDPAKTAGICGNSVSMIRSNYQRLYTKAEGEAYFAITPASVAAVSSAA